MVPWKLGGGVGVGGGRGRVCGRDGIASPGGSSLAPPACSTKASLGVRDGGDACLASLASYVPSLQLFF